MNDDERSADEEMRLIEQRQARERRRRRAMLIGATLLGAAVALAMSTGLLLSSRTDTATHVVGYLASALAATGLLATAARLAPHRVEQPQIAVCLAIANLAACAVAIAHALTVTRRWW